VISEIYDEMQNVVEKIQHILALIPQLNAEIL
jgi:hypothetical protein